MVGRDADMEANLTPDKKFHLTLLVFNMDDRDESQVSA